MYENETEAIRLQDIAATQEIRDAFASYFAGNSRATVPYALGAGGVMFQTVTSAIQDCVTDGAPLAAFQALMTGTGDMQSLQDALVADYIKHHAGSVAQERAAWDAPEVHRFAMEGAIA